MDEKRFKIEDKKYSGLWKNGYKDANWKKLANEALKMKSLYKNPSLIDFGLGNGNALDFFEGKDFHVEGVDISSYAVEAQRKSGRKVYHASLDNLSMIKNNQFSVGFCNDVLEHMPEELVAASIKEMSRVCLDYLFISVCPKPSHHLSLEGENLHLTVRPEHWWSEQFSNFGEVKRLRFLFSRSLRYVIRPIK